MRRHIAQLHDLTMNVGVIDIGTNTVLLLIAQFSRSGEITPVVYEQRVPRLGKGVDTQKRLAPESMQRTLSVLREYRSILERHSLSRIAVCGTSAVRDARNNQEFVDLVRSNVGFEVEILSGKEEALWTYRGAISGLPEVGKTTVLDIGGGSTEITSGEHRSITSSFSLDVGSVRLTERCFFHDPPAHAEVKAAEEVLDAELSAVQNTDLNGSTLIGVAGTATSLAVLAQGLQEFSLSAVTNYTLQIDKVRSLLSTLLTMPSHTIRNLSAIMEGRSDVITAGALILYRIMDSFSFDEIVVSERGVRFGLAIREWERRNE